MSDITQQMDKLEIPIKLSFPVINVSTFELGRAESVFSDIAKKVGKHFIVMPFKKLPDPGTMKAMVDESKKSSKNGVVVFDTFFFDRQRANPETLPALKSSLTYLENEGINYIIAGKDVFNEEFVYHIDLPAMSNQEILKLLQTCEDNVKDGGVFESNERAVIANHALGLSHTQMKNVFTYSAYLKFKGEEYLGEIRKEKAHILRDVGLDVLEAIDIGNVGGLENLKEFLQIRKAGWDKDLPVKGVLLAGVPGGGKSLTAKAAAGVLGTTLVRLDNSQGLSQGSMSSTLVKEKFGLDLGAMCRYDKPQHVEFKVLPDQTIQFRCSWFEGGGLTWWPFYTEHDVKSAEATSVLNDIFQGTEGHDE